MDVVAFVLSAYRPCAVTSLCVMVCVATVSVAILSVNFARACAVTSLCVMVCVATVSVAILSVNFARALEL